MVLAGPEYVCLSHGADVTDDLRINWHRTTDLLTSVSITLSQGDSKMLGTILIILLVLMLLGSVPSWPHSRSWGYGPSGGLGLVLLILIILVLLDKLPIG